MLKNIMNKMNKKKKKGFTLIELIIVIAIIAILAAIALPKFMSVRETSNVKADISNAKNIHTVVATLIADGTIDATSQNFTLTETTGTVVTGKLQSIETVKAKDYKNEEFRVAIDDEGEVVIYSGTSNIKIYPNGASPYAGN